MYVHFSLKTIIIQDLIAGVLYFAMLYKQGCLFTYSTREGSVCMRGKGEGEGGRCWIRRDHKLMMGLVCYDIVCKMERVGWTIDYPKT